VSFAATPGRVCGLLGANGAGKNTALRVLLGLARADSGRALVGGAPFVPLDAPPRVVGARVGRAAAGSVRAAITCASPPGGWV